MRIRTPQFDEESPINLMPLLDMVFLLLIFFLVATTIAQEEREQALQLPPDSQRQALSDPPKQLIINIMKDGSIKISGRIYSPKDLATLIQQVAEKEPNREVLIRADELSIHRYFAGVARLARQAGINELKIGYVFDSQPAVAP